MTAPPIQLLPLVLPRVIDCCCGTRRASCVLTHPYVHKQYTEARTGKKFSIKGLRRISAIFSVLLLYDWNTHTHTHKASLPRGQHARHLSNCHIHFLPPVSGAEASNNAVRTHKTQTPKREGRAPFVLFLEWVLLILKRERDRDGSAIHIPDEWK